MSAPALANQCPLAPEYTFTAVGTYAAGAEAQVADAGVILMYGGVAKVTFDDTASGQILLDQVWYGTYTVDAHCNGLIWFERPNQEFCMTFHGDGNHMVGIVAKNGNTQILTMDAQTH